MNGHDNDDMPKKRHRRTANEINRKFVCYCGKAYGSEGSLNQHKKNKGHYDDNMKTIQPLDINIYDEDDQKADDHDQQMDNQNEMQNIH